MKTRKITVTIRMLKSGDCMLVSGRWSQTGRPSFLLGEVFGKVPPVGFHRITYTANKRGAYEITDYGSGGFCFVKNKRGIGIRACFFPASMSGLRVSRKVTPVHKAVRK